MTTEYDNFFNQVGITNETDKMIVMNFMETLLNTTLEIINKEQNKQEL